MQHRISTWLFVSSFFVFLMIIVGGLTRLTESGLSMTNWHPVNEIIPPISRADWQQEFSNYKNSPEFIHKNYDISLKEFKNIYYWEFSHRLLGRVTGLVFLVPFIYFLIAKQIKGKEVWKFLFLFLIGGMQGLIGWWMVKSGLVDKPDVSHIRLSVHLGTAIIILSFLFYFALDYKFHLEENRQLKPIKFWATITYLILFTQIIYGAFLAGLNGGLIYNTWPNMNDNFIAPEAFGKLSSIYDNISTIQFIHRWLAFIVLIFIGFLYFKIKSYIRKTKDNSERIRLLLKSCRILKILLLVQIILGITTLVYNVPLILASLHQINATLMILSLVAVIRFSSTNKKSPVKQGF